MLTILVLFDREFQDVARLLTTAEGLTVAVLAKRLPEGTDVSVLSRPERISTVSAMAACHDTIIAVTEPARQEALVRALGPHRVENGSLRVITAMDAHPERLVGPLIQELASIADAQAGLLSEEALANAVLRIELEELRRHHSALESYTADIQADVEVGTFEASPTFAYRPRLDGRDGATVTQLVPTLSRDLSSFDLAFFAAIGSPKCDGDISVTIKEVDGNRQIQSWTSSFQGLMTGTTTFQLSAPLTGQLGRVAVEVGWLPSDNAANSLGLPGLGVRTCETAAQAEWASDGMKDIPEPTMVAISTWHLAPANAAGFGRRARARAEKTSRWLKCGIPDVEMFIEHAPPADFAVVTVDSAGDTRYVQVHPVVGAEVTAVWPRAVQTGTEAVSARISLPPECAGPVTFGMAILPEEAAHNWSSAESASAQVERHGASLVSRTLQPGGQALLQVPCKDGFGRTAAIVLTTTIDADVHHFGWARFSQFQKLVPMGWATSSNQ